jgi:phenylacetate-CoA ligase
MPSAFSFATLKRLYQSCPLWMQRLYSSIPFSLRAGAVYRETRRLIRQTEYLGAEDLRARQAELLARLLTHACRNVPHYSQRFGNLATEISADTAWEKFEQLPLVEKKTLQAAGTSFQSVAGLREPAYEDNTGGSSGTPFTFLKNNSMYPIELAYMFNQWERVGYRPGDPKLTLRGRTFAGRSADRRWDYNPIYNEIAISSYHLNVETLRRVMDRVRRFRPRFIHGYPSAIVTFLKVVQKHDLGLPEGVEAVLCGSEPLYDYQRQFIHETLNCRAYSWYGQSECVLLAGECEHSSEYHSFPLYGILELIDESGGPIVAPGIEGEIVGTSLNNYAMPFIRYRTGDRGILSLGECKCGRAYPRLQRVTGRQQHFVITSRGTRVPVTAFVFGQHFAAFGHITGMQLYQEEPGKVIVRILQGANFAEQHEKELRDKMTSAVDGELEVSFEYPDEFARNAAGKTDFVIQKVADSSNSTIRGHQQAITT